MTCRLSSIFFLLVVMLTQAMILHVDQNSSPKLEVLRYNTPIYRHAEDVCDQKCGGGANIGTHVHQRYPCPQMGGDGSIVIPQPHSGSNGMRGPPSERREFARDSGGLSCPSVKLQALELIAAMMILGEMLPKVRMLL